MANYQYLLEDGQVAVTVDAAWSVPRIRRYADKLGVRVVGALYTHGHFDHVGGQVSGRPSVEGASSVSRHFAAGSRQTGLHVESFTSLEDGQGLFPFTGLRVEVIDTPGHSAGGVSYLVRSEIASEACPDGILFTGDTVFIKAVGRTDLPGASTEELLRSLSRLSNLGNRTLFLSGHSYDSPPRHAALQEILERNSWMQEGVRRYPPGTQPLPHSVMNHPRGGDEARGEL